MLNSWRQSVNIGELLVIIDKILASFDWKLSTIDTIIGKADKVMSNMCKIISKIDKLMIMEHMD